MALAVWLNTLLVWLPTDRTHNNHQNDGQHYRILCDILSPIILPNLGCAEKISFFSSPVFCNRIRIHPGGFAGLHIEQDGPAA